MQLESLVFDVKTEKLKEAVDVIDSLASSMKNLNAAVKEETKVSETAAKSSQTVVKAKREEANANEDVAKSAGKVQGLIDKLTNTYSDMARGATKGESSQLNYARSLGATAKELEMVIDLQQKIGSLNKNPFDASIGSLRSINQELELLKKRAGLVDEGVVLTSKHMYEFGKIAAEVKAQFETMGKDITSESGMEALDNEIQRVQRSYINVVKEVDKFSTAEKEKQRQMRETTNALRTLSDMEEKSATMVATYTGAVQAGGSVTEQTAARIATFAHKLKLSGIDATEAAARLKAYSAQQSIIAAQEQKQREAYLTRAIIPQFSDIFVGLTTGMNPLTVALQQLPQIQDLFTLTGVKAQDTVKVIGNAAGEMVFRLKDTALAVTQAIGLGFLNIGKTIYEGVINPFKAVGTSLVLVTTGFSTATAAASDFGPTIAPQLLGVRNAIDLAKESMIGLTKLGIAGLIAVLGTLAVSTIAAIKEQYKLNQVLNLQGSAMGITTSAVYAQANAMEALGIRQSDTIKVVSEMANAGKLSKDSIEQITVAAVKLRDSGGVAIEETVKNFSDLAKDPVKAVEKLNEKYNFLTADVYLQIRALEEQGRTTDAAKLAQQSYADMIETRAKTMNDNLGILAKGWKLLSTAASNAWDSMLNLGRDNPEEKLQQALATMQGKNFLQGGLAFGGKEEALAIIRVYEARAEAAKKETEEQVKNNAATEGTIELSRTYAQFADKQIKKQSELNKVHADYAKALAGAAGNIQRQTELAKMYEASIAGINDKFKEKEKSTDKADKVLNAYNATLERFSDLKIQVNRAESDGANIVETSTKAYGLLLDVMSSPEWAKWDTKKKERILLEWEQIQATEIHNIQLKEQEKALKQLEKLWDDFDKINLKYTQKIQDTSDELKFQYSILGKSEDQVKVITREYEKQKNIAKINAEYEKERLELSQKYQAAIKGLESNPSKKLEAEKKYQEELLALETNRITETSQELERANLKVIQEYERNWKEIQQGLSDALYISLTEGGKEGAKAIRKLIEEQLKKRFIMPAIDVVVNFIAGGVTKLASGVVGAVAGALGVSSDSWLGELVGLAGGGAGLALVNKVIGNTSGGSSGSKIVDAIADAIPTGNQLDSLVAGYNLTSEATVSAIASYSDAAIKMGEESVKYIKEASELMASTLPDVVEQGKQLMEKGVEMAEKAASYRTTSEYLSKGNNLAANGFMKTAFNAIAETKFGAALGFSKEISKGVYELTEIGASWGDELKQVGGFVEKAAPYFDAIIKLAQGDYKKAAMSAAVTYALSQIGAQYIPYGAAIMKLLDGQWKEALATAVTTYLGAMSGAAIGAAYGSSAGGPIGAAIGAILGSFIKFGGGEIYKKAIISASSAYKEDGTSSFTPIELLRVNEAGFEATEGLLAEYNRRAAAMLKAFDIDPTGLQSTLGMRQRRSSHKTVASFGVNKEGEGLPLSNSMSLFYGTRGNPLTAFEDFARDILGQGLKLAINAFDVPGNIKKLFEGISTNDAMDAAFRKILELDVILTLFGSGLREFIGDIDFAALAKEGEVGFDVVGRVLQEVLGLNAVFQTLNFTLFELTANGVRGTLLFKELLGGAEEYEKYLNEYYNNFFSEAEKRANTIKSIESQLQMAGADISKMNLGEMTRMQYRELLEATIEAKGATDPLSIALIKLSSTFASVTEEITYTTKELADKARAEAERMAIEGSLSSLGISFENLKRAIDAERKAIADRTKASIDSIKLSIKSSEAEKVQVNNRISEFKRLMDSISSAISKLRSVANQEMQLVQARKFIDNAIVQVKSGILPDADKLSDVLSVLTSDSIDAYTSIAEFEYAQLVQAGKLEELNQELGKQKTIAELQLDSLEKANLQYERQIELLNEDAARQNAILDNTLSEAQRQVELLQGIDNSVMSVADAITDFKNWVMSVESLRNKYASDLANSMVSGIPASSRESVNTQKTVPWSPLENEIAGLYRNILGREIDTYGLSYWANSGLTLAEIAAGIRESYEYQARGNNVATQNAYNSLVSAGLGTSTNILARAEGGYTPPGLTLVGEEGPELVNFNSPGMVYTAAQTSNLMNNSDNAELVQAITRLEARLANIERNTREQKDTLYSVTEGGNAMRTQSI